MDTKMQTSRCAELAAEAMGRLPGEIRANRRDLPLQGVHDVALRIELQGRIELHMQHFESRHLHFHRAVGAELGHVLQLLRPHWDLAGAGGGAVPAPQLGALQRVIHGGHGSLHRTHRRWAASPGSHMGSGTWACVRFVWVYIAKSRGKRRGGRKERRKELMKDKAK